MCAKLSVELCVDIVDVSGFFVALLSAHKYRIRGLRHDDGLFSKSASLKDFVTGYILVSLDLIGFLKCLQLIRRCVDELMSRRVHRIFRIAKLFS